MLPMLLYVAAKLLQAFFPALQEAGVLILRHISWRRFFLTLKFVRYSRFVQIKKDFQEFPLKTMYFCI